jgi:acyl-CoA synthetase (AMP-forming)/AMP-acid ligase II
MNYTSPFPPLETGFAALPQLVCDIGASTLEQPAIVTGADDPAISYGMLASQIGRVAADLVSRGFSPGDVLAIRAPNTPAWAAVALGAMAAGGAVTGISPLAVGREITHQLTDSGAGMLVTASSLLADSRAAAAAAGTAQVLDIRDLSVPADGNRSGDAPGGEPLPGKAPVNDVTPGPGQVALLPYSSGTTGLPKGCMLTHANLTAAARQLGRGLALTPRDRFLGIAPLAHVMGFVIALCAPLAAGATVVMLPRYDLHALLASIQRHRVTVVIVPPQVASALARAPAVRRYDLSRVEMVISGGAPPSREPQQHLAGRFPSAVIGQGYGLTEAPTILVPVRAGMPPGSAGQVAPGTELRLVDPVTGHDAEPGERGELWARGPQVMTGYLGRPEATAQMLDPQGWLHTGDLGRIDANGHVFVVDRLKELIKVNAFQVAPAELEALLVGHPQVADAAVIPRPDKRTGEVPVAVVVPRGPLEPRQLIAWVAARVSPHKRIRAVSLVSEIPRTPSGKIMRRLLIEADRGARSPGRQAAASPDTTRGGRDE